MEREILSNLGIKVTPTRLVILEHLKESGDCLSVHDLYSRLADKYDLSQATIYRTCGLLYEKGIIFKTISPDGIAYYSYDDKTNDHIIECEKCHKQVKLNFCPLNQFEQEVQMDTGFEITKHSLKLYGLCPNCK